MDTKTATFRSLIAGPRQYRIPPFQRPYSWEKPERETLWLDILTQYERVAPVWPLEEAEREERLTVIPSHYLGTIVLAGPTALGVPKSEVIDGQQRITTVLLALAALRDARVRSLRKLQAGEADLDQILGSARRKMNNAYLINDDADGDERLRVVPQMKDKKAFVACLTHDGATQLSAASLGLSPSDSPRTVQAYQFFFTEFRRQAVDESRNPQLARFASLFPLDFDVLEEVLASRLSMILIETKNLDDVNAIFESLNAKGKPLSQLDLLRNYIFMLLRGRATQVLEDHWNPIERDHLPRPSEVEQLIWADLVSQGHNILQNRTYRTIQAVLRQQGGTPDAAESYVKALARTASYFEHLLRPNTDPNPAIANALQRLNRAGGRTAYPVVLWLYQERHAARCEDAEIVESIRLLESFYVRRFLSGLSPNNLNSMVGSLLSRIHAKVDTAADDVVGRLAAALLHNAKDWPTDDELRYGIQTTRFYGNGKTHQRIFVLSELDRSYHPQTVLNYEQSDDSIEHILPQGRDSLGWEADMRELGEDFGDVQDRLAHTLGNLTVVAPVMNSALGQKRFEEKCDLYRDSPYALTQRVASDFGDVTRGHTLWGTDAILGRADVLHAVAVSIWARPAQGAHDGAPIEDIAELEEAEGEEPVPFTSSVPEEEESGQE